MRRNLISTYCTTQTQLPPKVKKVEVPVTLYNVACIVYEPDGMRPSFMLVAVFPNKKNLGFFSVLRFTNLFLLLYNSEVTVTLLTVPEPHDITASILVLLHGGGLRTKVPFVNVVTKVSVLELYKSHRARVHLLAVGGGIGAFDGVLVGDFVGLVVCTSVGFFVGIKVGFSVGSSVGDFVGTSVGRRLGAVEGALVGCLVMGETVGILLGVKVGALVKTFVGTNVGWSVMLENMATIFTLGESMVLPS